MVNTSDVDTVVAAEIVTSNELEGMSLDQLGMVAAAALGEVRRLQVDAVGLARKSTVMVYRAGRALWHAKELLKAERSWTSFQKKHGIPISSARQAILLFEKAGSEEEVASLTRTQAYQKYGIIKPKRDKSAQTATTEPASERSEAENVEPTPTTEVPPRADLDVAGMDTCGALSPETGPELPLSSRRPENEGRTSSDPGMDQSTKPRKPESPGMPVTLGEALFALMRKLEKLEHGLAETGIAQADLDLMDQAIETLQRMKRCDVREKAA